MMRDEIKKIVEECTTEVANRVTKLIEARFQAALSTTVRKAKKRKTVKVPKKSTETKRRYTRTEKAKLASRNNIAKARETRLAKLREVQAVVEQPANVAQ